MHSADAVSTVGYSFLHFSLKGLDGGNFEVQLRDSASGNVGTSAVTLPNSTYSKDVNGWKVYDIPLSAFGAQNKPFWEIVFYNNSGSVGPTIYIDDVRVMPDVKPVTTVTGLPLKVFGTYILSKSKVVKARFKKINIDDYKNLEFDVIAKKPLRKGFNVVLAKSLTATVGAKVDITNLTSTRRHLIIPLSQFNVPAGTLIAGLRLKDDNLTDAKKGNLLINHIRLTK